MCVRPRSFAGLAIGGACALDFKQSFDVGSSDRTILQVDGDGVALAAIQALARRVEQLEQDNQRLQSTLEALRAAEQRQSKASCRRPAPEKD